MGTSHILSISILKKQCSGHEFNSDMAAINRGSLIHRCIENGGAFDNIVSYKGYKKEIPYDNDDVAGIVALASATCRKYVRPGGRQESIIQMNLNDDYTIEGIMDYCEIDDDSKTALIIDFKTGYSGVYNEQNKSSMYQAYIYPLMMFESYKFLQEITFKYVFIDEGFYEIEVKHTRQEYDEKVQKVKDWIVKTYEKQEYKAGEHCANCNRINNCQFVNKFMKEVEQDLDTGGPMIQNDKEYTTLNAYIKIAEKKMDLYKETKADDPSYWLSRTTNNNELVTSALIDGDEALKILEALAKNGALKLTKAQYESLLAKAPERVTTSSFTSKVFKMKKQ